jgi:hypothetical protein
VGRKVFLPLTQRFADSVATPTVKQMRERLGGKFVSGARLERDGVVLPLGSFVAFEDSGRLGVLLSVGESSVDVYVDRGTVKRTLPASVGPHRGRPPAELEEVSASVALFARIAEGERVSVERSPGLVVEGTLVEKCRYGAIVELDGAERVTLAVGFRKIWPSDRASSPGVS